MGAMMPPTEQMAPLRAVLDYLEQHPAPLDHAQRLRLCGMVHYYLGNRPRATTMLAKAIDLDEDDLLSAYYLTQSLDGDMAQTADTRRQVLQLAVAYTKSGEMEPEPLYYAGHIFFQNGMIEAAERCFGRCDDLLPALYMELAVMHHANPDGDLGAHVGYLLKTERQAIQRGEPGFLSQCHRLTIAPGQPGWQAALLHHAQTRELAETVRWIHNWLADYQRKHNGPHPDHAPLQPTGKSGPA